MTITKRHFLIQAGPGPEPVNLWRCATCYGSFKFYGGREGLIDHMETRAHKLNLVQLWRRRRDAAQKDFEEAVALHASAILNPLEPL